jgi:hypothetical protein
LPADKDGIRMSEGNAEPGAARALRLVEAVRQARIDMAERSGVVVDLHDAEVARLEILNEALDPLFVDIAPEIELFERGITRGDPPRLWIDMIAHVVMGRDKRHYRFVQDTRYGRRVLGESADVDEVAGLVTKYVARRLIERERALAGDTELVARDVLIDQISRRRRRRRMAGVLIVGLLFGALAGIGGLFALAWWSVP